jgi:hypothetical protein
MYWSEVNFWEHFPLQFFDKILPIALCQKNGNKLFRPKVRILKSEPRQKSNGESYPFEERLRDKRPPDVANTAWNIKNRFLFINMIR